MSAYLLFKVNGVSKMGANTQIYAISHHPAKKFRTRKSTISPYTFLIIISVVLKNSIRSLNFPKQLATYLFFFNFIKHHRKKFNYDHNRNHYQCTRKKFGNTGQNPNTSLNGTRIRMTGLQHAQRITFTPVENFMIIKTSYTLPCNLVSV